MRIFILVDMEGISGICRSTQVTPGTADYAAARTFLTRDVNACVQGCFEGGATEVVVRDAHWAGFNLLWDDLDPRARYVQGRSLRERIPGIADCSGLILLGYHAMAGTAAAILEHTMSSAQWQNLWMNGKKAGEVALDAGMAGDRGVPTIMVSGDDKLCREARALLPGVVAVQVKEGLDVEGGILLTADEAHRRIRNGAARAVRKCRAIKPHKVRKPVTLRLELVSRGVVPVARENIKVIDGRTFEVKARTVEEALNMLL